MNKATKTILAIVIIGSLLGLVSTTLIDNKKEMETRVYHPDVNTAVVIQADTVTFSTFGQSNSYTGSFNPNREVVIGSETAGKVIKVNVNEGSFIRAGGLIAQLDAELVEAQLHSAQASYRRAVNTLDRYQQAASGVTQLQLDNARTDILTTRAQVEQLKAQHGQFRIAAPFSGIITSRNFDLGAVVSPGTPMATLSDIGQLKLEIAVPEKGIAGFKSGQAVNVRTDVYPGQNFNGRVNMISSKADASHNFLIEILVPNPGQKLKAGMYGTVELNNTVSSEALTIPRSALLGSSINPQVYVIENGKAKLRDIVLGTGNETRVQVNSGLQNGDIVASGGLVNLKEGARVSIAQ